jgi:hypothetical protein
VQLCTEEVRKVYELFSSRENLDLVVADDYNRLSPELQQEVLAKLQKMAAR